MKMTALISPIHQGSPLFTAVRHLHGLVELADVLLGARGRRPATSCRFTRARSATEVPFERTTTSSPVEMPRTRRRGRRARSRAPAAGTGAPRRARPPGPRRARGSGASRAGRRFAVGCLYGAGTVGGAAGAGSARGGSAACSLGGDRARVRVDLDAEALGELRDPGELVRARAGSPCGAGAAGGPRG